MISISSVEFGFALFGHTFLARVGQLFSRRLRPEELGQRGLELVCDRRERRCEIGADRAQRPNRGNRDESSNTPSRHLAAFS